MLTLAHQRMRSVLMHRMQLAWKRLSASLWKAWRHGNVVDLMTFTDSTPTIPHMFSKCKDSGFPYGCADAAAADSLAGCPAGGPVPSRRAALRPVVSPSHAPPPPAPPLRQRAMAQLRPVSVPAVMISGTLASICHPYQLIETTLKYMVQSITIRYESTVSVCL